MLCIGCSTVPLSKGMFKRLPTSEMSLLVWGHDPSLVNTVILWLHSRSVPVIEPSIVREHIGKFGESEAVWVDETTVLRAARAMHATQVAFVKRIGDYRAPAVFVRGVDASSGEVVWAGTSRYSKYASDPAPHTLALLTCRALEAAWQLGGSVHDICATTN